MSLRIGLMLSIKNYLLHFGLWLILTIPPTLKASTLYVHPTDTICGGNFPCYNSFREAQTIASEGDSLILLNGTYLGDGGISVLAVSKQIHIEGESISGVIIEASSSGGWGIWVGAPNVSIGKLTIQNASGFGLVNESGEADGLKLYQIRVKDGGKTGVALRNVKQAKLYNLHISGNMGNALSLTSASHILVDSLKSFGNQFQAFNGFTASIGIFSTREDGISSDIDIQGVLDVDEPVYVYLHPGPIDTANILTNPPEEITSVRVPDSIYAIVGIDVPIILNNPALPNQNFGGISGADALYFFNDMSQAATCAEVAARENDGILEPYVFLYNRITEERSLLPNITSNPQDITYNGSRSVQFHANLSAKSANSPEIAGHWEVKKGEVDFWEALPEETPYEGTQTTTLTVTPFSLEMDEYQFRYIARNQWGKDTSQTAVVEVPKAFLECTFPPQLYCPKDSVVEISSLFDPQSQLFGMAEAHSGCSGVIRDLYYIDEDFRSDSNLIGDYLRTWIARDELGNSDSCGQWISFVQAPLPVSQLRDLESLPSFDIYPNPTEYGIFIEAPNFYIQKYDLRVVDILGKTVLFKGDINPLQTHFVETKNWSPGVYRIHISMGVYSPQTYQVMLSP